jgi:hypothetical protein
MKETIYLKRRKLLTHLFTRWTKDHPLVKQTVRALIKDRSRIQHPVSSINQQPTTINQPWLS